MLFLKSKEETLDVTDYTVIIPSICVGNAAQLACDLLIASKQLKRIGSVTHPALIPVFGPSAYQHEPNEKVSSCELYEGVEDKLLVIQFRAPWIARHTRNFQQQLVELIKGAKRVIILSGSFGFEKRVIEASPWAYRASENFKLAHAAQLGNPDLIKWKEHTGEAIYGGGNALQLFKAFDEAQVQVMLLFRYLIEGDNSTDASLIVRELNELCEDFLQLRGGGDGSFKLTVPKSWNLLFGNDVTEFLF
ncbi:GL12012 [Drosophila persimilis]|uniref:Proteasome assembly chaperone 2 n=2 Tax=pseudoobscura subgroup TaxID=32358 RepID=A0A6I8URZ9_DROPS|nr:proteasome assembly chaperone 2 [Drosophila pseudoobscura]XP_002019805.1 proteasome assembly chaperone 2 [Drosophila persimilis]EDW38439.1 GL12012 [Drosophila persimilis]